MFKIVTKENGKIALMRLKDNTIVRHFFAVLFEIMKINNISVQKLAAEMDIEAKLIEEVMQSNSQYYGELPIALCSKFNLDQSDYLPGLFEIRLPSITKNKEHALEELQENPGTRLKRHNCKKMIDAIKKLENDEKLEIYYLSEIPNLEVMKEVQDSSYGAIEESVYIEINYCPFCGQELMNTV